jgi:hypothetical protein
MKGKRGVGKGLTSDCCDGRGWEALHTGLQFAVKKVKMK